MSGPTQPDTPCLSFRPISGSQRSSDATAPFKWGVDHPSPRACKLLPFLLVAMVHAPGRQAFSGPALIRLLARLTDARFSESGPPLADRLVQWLGWTDAIALSSALSTDAPAGCSRERMPEHAEDALCARVRMSLTNAIAREATLAPQRERRHSHARHRQDHAAADVAPEYAAFRQRYLALQEEMETAIGNLRAVLRGMLASRGGATSRLAQVDAVMERVLGVREHNALAAVPGLLAAHFERLRDAELATNGHEQAEPGALQDGQQNTVPDAASRATPAIDPPKVKDGPWLDAFRKDMQSVLFAELDIRFQPVEGLRAALRAC